MATQRHQSNSHSHSHDSSTDLHSKQTDSNHASSAFSPSANPNEDWTKISDLAERRRIQNRIAQRNYRKKLKRRLEDLERKAASTSSSPEQEHLELPEPKPRKHSRSNSNPKSIARQPSQSSSSYSYEPQTSPELFAMDQQFPSFDTRTTPDFALVSPPTYSYSNFQSTASYFPGDSSFPVYQQIPQAYYDCEYPRNGSQNLASTLPSMMPSENVKQGNFIGDDDLLSPFSMNFASLAGMEGPPRSSYSDFSSRTPPLSDSNPSSASRENSPLNFTLPMTPISRSTSPNVRLFNHLWQFS